ncbi:MAG TPA: c-type cytochrome domain-containing protein [Kofleriaceae bacterium]|nr:c-type cytochrome domain-containing protein [Kofleriaceae bacterium]
MTARAPSPSLGRRAAAAALALALACLAAACIERREELPRWTCDDDPSPPSWSRVSAAVMRPSCGTVACHSAVARRADLVLDSEEAGYASLVDADPEPFVRAGDPGHSELMYLLAGVDVARMMPPDAPLPEADVELVKRWICAGAEDD